jgi:hypothetical protein
VRERRGRVLQGSIDLSKCQEGLSNPGHGVYILPLPLLAVMSKTRTSRTVRDALADCPRLNSNGKNAKSTAGGTGRCAGRTVRPVHRAAPCSVKNNGPSAWGPRTVRPEAYFLKNFCQKSQTLNKKTKTRGPSTPRARTVRPTPEN